MGREAGAQRGVRSWTVSLSAVAWLVVGPAVVGAQLGFDGDRFPDLVIGQQHRTVSSNANAGMATVLPGSAAGPTATGVQEWHQDVPDVASEAWENEQFASSFAIGDFDGDGYFDLVVGVPYQRDGGVDGAGDVNVFYGGANGLSASRNFSFGQNWGTIGGECEYYDLFGSALAAGDFDDDGYDDVAIGVKSEDIGAVANAGAVNVVYGSASGLDDAGNQLFYQGELGIQDAPEAEDQFGESLTVGDFNADGYDDLAVGAPQETIPNQDGLHGGQVHVIFGSAAGLTGNDDQAFNQHLIYGLAESERDFFGAAVAAGDFNCDGYDDLAVGSPSESIEDPNDIDYVGKVTVLFGGWYGLSTVGVQTLQQGFNGLTDASEYNDRFGKVLEAGDFDGDGCSDLAVGVHYEDVVYTDDGAVHVIYGSRSGLTGVGDELWHLNSSGVPDECAEYDDLGMALAADDFNGDGREDLAVAVAYEDGSGDDIGAVLVLFGTAGGLTGSGSQWWTQEDPTLPSAAENGSRFGLTLGAHGWETRLFADGFERGHDDRWSSSVGK